MQSGMIPKEPRSINATDQLMCQQEMLARNQPTEASRLANEAARQRLDIGRSNVVNAIYI
ncbi:hypothetical protein AGMMS50243_02980 [Betaproteobacteria bacterium]|nr:hypothetical protein AGMMS50243_02980 [Betaproteobacteria bacterium]